MNALEDTTNDATVDEEEFEYVWTEIPDERMSWEGHGWSEGDYEGAEWNASGSWEELQEGGVYRMLN